MRSGLLIVAAIFFMAKSELAQETTPASLASSLAMKLADATPVFLRTKEELSSGTAKVGDRVALRVIDDVKVGDLVVIRSGAGAWGVVTAVQGKRRKGHPGSFEVSIQSVQLLTGQSAPLRAEERAKGAGGSMAADMTDAAMREKGLGPLLVLPFVPLFLLEKGKDARLPSGTRFTAYLNGDLPLDRTALERLQPVVSRHSGPATVIVFRAKAKMGRSNKPSVFCGRIALARLPNGGYLKVPLPPGKYFFRSNDDQVLELRLDEGQDVYVEMQMSIRGLTLKGHLRQVSNSEGGDELAILHELSGKDVATISDAPLSDLQATPDRE